MVFLLYVYIHIVHFYILYCIFFIFFIVFESLNMVVLFVTMSLDFVYTLCLRLRDGSYAYLSHGDIMKAGDYPEFAYVGV